MRSTQVGQRHACAVDADGAATDFADIHKRNILAVEWLVRRIGDQIARLGFVKGEGGIHWRQFGTDAARQRHLRDRNQKAAVRNIVNRSHRTVGDQLKAAAALAKNDVVLPGVLLADAELARVEPEREAEREFIVLCCRRRRSGVGE